jgi:formylmethanofuran dehydrogenase subunit E
MQQESGYCDRCGAVLTTPSQLTVDGEELCAGCVEDDARWSREARKREASTDGR